MREIFDRHQDKLTPAERRSIWETVSGSRPRKPRVTWVWALSTATAGLAAGVFALTVLRGPGGPSSSTDALPPRDQPATQGPLVEGNTTEREVSGLRIQRQPGASGPAETPATDALDQKEPLARGEYDGQGSDDSREEGRSYAVPMAEPGKQLEEIVVTNQAMRDKKVGEVATDGESHFRGGRGGETAITAERLVDRKDSNTRMGAQGPPPAAPPPPASSPPSPPVIPTTGGTHLPNDEVYDSMFFRNYGVNPFIPTDEDALSTFAVDVDEASYTVARRYIELGSLPPADAVRVEEFVNFFDQGYPHFERDDFRILIDGAPSPFGRGYHLLRVGIKGREIAEQDRKPAALTFVIDVSGSMAREDRLGLVKQSMRLLVDQLRDDDRVGIVVYGSQGRVLLEPTSLGHSDELAYRRRADDFREEESKDWRSGRRLILDAIEQLRPDGSTNAEEGLLLGYDMARRGYRPRAINRIVLCSDGVANVGRTGPESILARVRTEADRGIHLSTIGFGMGNYNDVLMEQLANDGDGNYYYVDDLGEARRVLEENLTGTLQTIAKDAKIQVEFHPSRVLRYRLIGFENRDVADRDFRNDKVDAGEIGAGHEVTALYEVKLAPKPQGGPIATVRLRYARPEHEGRGKDVREIARNFGYADLDTRIENASPHFRLDAAVAEFAEILRGSYWAKESRIADVLPLARGAARDLRTDAAAEFVSLAEKAAQWSGTPGLPEGEEER